MDFKVNASVSMHNSLLKLKHAVETIAVSSAECERGFSEMNPVVTPLHSQLKIENVSALMFIKMVGPPLTSWDPTKYVRKWVATRRSADHLACRQRCTTTQASPYQPIWDLMNLLVLILLQ
uniref:HAT C-terminal dimerisation domain-containing protein n=1 Tax=Anguilla anguilla TaxID=7936 RepID=A0A0E9WX86_ANGAN